MAKTKTLKHICLIGGFFIGCAGLALTEHGNVLRPSFYVPVNDCSPNSPCRDKGKHDCMCECLRDSVRLPDEPYMNHVKERESHASRRHLQREVELRKSNGR